MTQSNENAFDDIIERYDEALAEVRPTRESLTPHDRVTPAAPLYLYYRANFLADELQIDSESDRGQELQRVSESAHSLCEGDGYLDTVLEELETLIERYPQRICSAFELDPVSNEVEQTLYSRDHIEMILTFFESENVSDESSTLENVIHNNRIRVTTLDEVLKCEFRWASDLVTQNIEIFTREHYPETYWWRHPAERVLEEKGIR